MKIICAWCLKEGKPALVGGKEPLDDPEESHGVCPRHREELMGGPWGRGLEQGETKTAAERDVFPPPYRKGGRKREPWQDA